MFHLTLVMEMIMSRLVKTTLIAFSTLVLLTSEASAQYYNPAVTQGHGHQPGGAGLDIGFNRNGFTPNVGLGIGQVGAGVGAGADVNGIGTGFNTGIGPLGASADTGIGRNGIGVRASSGISTTGASLEGGWSDGGLGLGASTKLLGFGGGASLGVGDNGPGLGMSLAFGPLGTLLIGSHQNTYPGAQQTAAHIYPNNNAPYYASQEYGNPTYYNTAPTQYANYPQPTQAAPVQYRHSAHSGSTAPVQYVQQARPAYVQQPQQRQPTYSCPARWSC